jgi:hypothetical protein
MYKPTHIQRPSDSPSYLSTHDIPGAQPRKLMLTKGKKRFQFFEEQAIEELHMKAKYGAPLMARRIPQG